VPSLVSFFVGWCTPFVSTACIVIVPVPAILQNSDKKVIKIRVKYLQESNNKAKIISPVGLQLSTPGSLEQWYSTFFDCLPPDIICLQLCTPKVAGV
jgi:hypothetical protein